MLNVNDVRKQVLRCGSLTAAVGTGSVYDSRFNKYARKRELNLIVTSTGNQEFMIRQVPLFDNDDITQLREEADVNKYLHIGCVTISIEPLLHQRYIKQFGNKISGHCAIIDSTFRKLEESIISLHQYELNKRRADYVSYPNHCLSLSDPHLQKRMSILIGINGIDVEPGVELFSLCIGYIITGTNTLNPTKQLSQTSFAITGTSEVEFKDIFPETQMNLESSYNSVDTITLPSDQDIYFKSRGNALSRVLGSQKEIKRRTVRLKTPNPQGREHYENARSSVSIPVVVPYKPMSPDTIAETVKNKEIVKKVMEYRRQQALGRSSSSRYG
ncbi:TPA_asm: P3 [Phyllostachys alphacytorhabdovirus 1]|nr:TPA_asm: P3 [Phyllostachys alphacytorhabdovirus 1]